MPWPINAANKLNICYEVAEIYYNVVRSPIGLDAYRKAQLNHCEICNEY